MTELYFEVLFVKKEISRKVLKTFKFKGRKGLRAVDCFQADSIPQFSLRFWLFLLCGFGVEIRKKIWQLKPTSTQALLHTLVGASNSKQYFAVCKIMVKISNLEKSFLSKQRPS